MSPSTQDFQSRFTTAEAAKRQQENFIAQKSEPEKLPLLKKFLIKMDPANIRFENERDYAPDSKKYSSTYGDPNDPDSVSRQMKQHLQDMQNPDHIAPNTLSATQRENEILGAMTEKAEKKAFKRLGVSIIPAGFLGFGAMLGLSVTPVIGQIALGIAAIGALATYVGINRDEKEINSVARMLENTRKTYADKNFTAMEIKRDLKQSLEQQGSKPNTQTTRSRLMTGAKL